MNALNSIEPNISKSASEYLSFRIAEDEYSVDITSVREIRGWTRTTSLPHSPDFVRGVINLRGTVLPVVDLAIRLGFKTSEPEARNVIIVVDVGERVMGLRVDAVSDILSFEPGQLQLPPDISAGPKSRFVKALTVLEDRMVRILDLEAVLPSREEISA